MSICFSHPKDWKCFDELLSKYPRAINDSLIIRKAIEFHLSALEKKPSVTLDTYRDIVTPELEMDGKTWNKLLKGMDTTEVRKLKELMLKKMTLVDEVIYQRTL